MLAALCVVVRPSLYHSSIDSPSMRDHFRLGLISLGHQQRSNANRRNTPQWNPAACTPPPDSASAILNF